MGDCFGKGGRSLFFVGRLSALNLFLSTKGDRFFEIHFPPLYYLVDYKKIYYASA
jgi:hypothetical protein